MDDADTADVIEGLQRYIQVRDQLDIRDTSGGVLPRDFPLTKFVEKKGEQQLLRFLKEEPKPESKKPQDDKSTEKSTEKSTTEEPKVEAKPPQANSQPEPSE